MSKQFNLQPKPACHFAIAIKMRLSKPCTTAGRNKIPGYNSTKCLAKTKFETKCLWVQNTGSREDQIIPSVNPIFPLHSAGPLASQTPSAWYKRVSQSFPAPLFLTLFQNPTRHVYNIHRHPRRDQAACSSAKYSIAQSNSPLAPPRARPTRELSRALRLAALVSTSKAIGSPMHAVAHRSRTDRNLRGA